MSRPSAIIVNVTCGYIRPIYVLQTLPRLRLRSASDPPAADQHPPQSISSGGIAALISLSLSLAARATSTNNSTSAAAQSALLSSRSFPNLRSAPQAQRYLPIRPPRAGGGGEKLSSVFFSAFLACRAMHCLVCI